MRSPAWSWLPVPAMVALALLPTPTRAHHDSAETRAQAAERGGWDAIARALAEAEALRDEDDAASARRWFEVARALDAGDPRVAAFAAQLAFDASRMREADSLASIALAALPDALGPLLTRARARARLGDARGALADLDHAVTIDPSRAEEHVIERAQTAWELIGAAGALDALETQTAGAPWTPARRALAARLERELGREPRVRAGHAPAEPTVAIGRPITRTAATAATDTVIRLGATWRWFAGPAAPTGAWTTLGYDDGAWAAGPAPLGYGEARIATPVPYGGNAAHRWVTTYLRHRFTRSAATAVTAALLQADYDDGFVAYLNGVEVARRGLPLGPVAWESLAVNHESGTFETIPLSDPSAVQPGDNVLVIELHQQSPSSSDLLWDASLVLDTATVRRTRGPYLQSASPTAISIRWRTSIPVMGRVSLGPAGGPYTLEFDELQARTEHEVRVTGLSPETAYAYAVHAAFEAPEPVSAARTFRTPPLPGSDRPVRIWTIGDSGYNTLGGRQVRDAYLTWAGAAREDLWLMLGDNAYVAGTDAEYQSGLFDQYPLTLSRSPLWSTRGNHDQLYSGVHNDYYDLFTLPASGECGGEPSGTEAWYSFDWGPVHFVCLDSEGSSRTLASPMLQWLRADLAATTQPWVIGFWHHPPYTKGSHDSDDPVDSGGRMRDMRTNVLPVLDSLGVDLVLTGHSHSYERSSLIAGHYGTSATLTAAMQVDSGDGRPDGDGAYLKSPGPLQADEGTVYTVNGSACQISGGTLDHPAMITSLNVLGSMVIDVVGERLDARFIDHTGAVRDSFTILKTTQLSAPGSPGESSLSLEPARPMPFRSRTDLAFTMARAGHATLAVFDVSGRRVRVLVDGTRAAGPQRVTWDGRDARGARLPAGAYLVRLQAGGEQRTQRLVRLP